MIERILIVGFGSIGKRHFKIAHELFPYADIRILGHKELRHNQSGTGDLFASLEQALDFLPQLAVIANPATYHPTTAKALLQIGCHILIEKPLADSWEASIPLTKLAISKKLTLLLGYNLRYTPCLRQFRQYYLDGLIGKALSVRCEVGQFLPSWRPDKDYRTSVSAQQKLGGGVLLELSHELDYLCWIFGDALWVSASLSKQSDLEIDVEDTAYLILGFSERDRTILVSLNLDFIRHDTTRYCTIIGDKGSLRWDALRGTVEHYPAGAESWTQVFSSNSDQNQSYLAEWKHMIACINGEEQPLITLNDGLQVMKIIEVARRSSEEKGQQMLISKLSE